MNTNEEKRIATLQARAALLGLELVRHDGRLWKLQYRIGGDVKIFAISRTLDAIDFELTMAEKDLIEVRR